MDSRSETSAEQVILQTRKLDGWYGDVRVLKGVTMNVPGRKITALIGPSGCGKSTFIRCFNRMNDFIPEFRVEGNVRYYGIDLMEGPMDAIEIRRRIGMVFQKPNPFPKSIFDNIAYGPRMAGIRSNPTLEGIVEKTLRKAALWDEVKDQLRKSALQLSGGQQQRLCIARALAMEPEVLLLDEPCSALDPIGTGRIEELMIELKQSYTLVLVTHNMQQASRVSDLTGFFLFGELVEMGETSSLFTNPKDRRTEEYITGRFG